MVGIRSSKTIPIVFSIEMFIINMVGPMPCNEMQGLGGLCS